MNNEQFITNIDTIYSKSNHQAKSSLFDLNLVDKIAYDRLVKNVKHLTAYPIRILFIRLSVDHKV
jgi:hypothetical protein